MSEAFSALWASIVRTVVPVIVGSALAWVAGLGITVDAQFEVLFGTVLTTVFTGIYYIGVRLLETYITPKFGWLLLMPKAPVVYSKESASKIPEAVSVATATVNVTAEISQASDTPTATNSRSDDPGVG